MIYERVKTVNYLLKFDYREKRHAYNMQTYLLNKI